jgi:ABC-type Fe3+ transport system substrate-binding protein
MIKYNQTISYIAEKFPEVIPEFEKTGMGNYFSPDTLTKTGKFIRLGTLLSASNLDSGEFLKRLNEVIKENGEKGGNGKDDLQFLAMLPCGLRNPFKEFVETEIKDHPKKYAGLNYLTEGNVNHELSYYPLLDYISSIDELPDIILASDVNNFFHKPFVEKFIESGKFKAFYQFEPEPYLARAGYFDPHKHFTMFTANMLVMVVDKSRLGSRPVPRRWRDLLSNAFENEIIMRGENDFFCNAVMLPFYKDHGFQAIKTLARNIKAGKHPAQMVKLAASGKKEAAAVYIMPYFFAKTIRKREAEIVWPQDGAIASPVFLLVKHDKIGKHRALLDFLMSEKTGTMLKGRFFPSVNPKVKNDFPEPVKWLGWDFLLGHDIGKLKEDIRNTFNKVWIRKSL